MTVFLVDLEAVETRYTGQWKSRVFAYPRPVGFGWCRLSGNTTPITVRVYADGQLASKEAYLMRKICNLLDVEPGYLAEVKKRMDTLDELGAHAIRFFLLVIAALMIALTFRTEFFTRDAAEPFIVVTLAEAVGQDGASRAGAGDGRGLAHHSHALKGSAKQSRSRRSRTMENRRISSSWPRTASDSGIA